MGNKMVTKAKTVQINSLGQAQANLEYTTNELRLAQANFERAQERLSLAEEGHSLATSHLVAEVATVRGKSKVIPTLLR
jgi:hypothetical protein